MAICLALAACIPSKRVVFPLSRALCLNWAERRFYFILPHLIEAFRNEYRGCKNGEGSAGNSRSKVFSGA